MAIECDLHPDLLRWQRVHEILSAEDDKTFSARLCMFDSRVIKGATPVEGLPVASIAQWNLIVDSVRMLKQFPIRPVAIIVVIVVAVIGAMW